VCTIFDLIKDDSSKITVDYELLRKGRCGLALTLAGIYALSVGLRILIPDVSMKGRVAEAYDGNIWQYYEWKRANVAFCSLWVILLGLCIIQFSFSDFFGNNVYLAIVMMKIGDQFLGLWLEAMLEENLLFSPLQIFYSLIGDLVTFGSPDFLSFVSAYFIGFGMMIFERNYADDIVDLVKDYIENEIPSSYRGFVAFLNTDRPDANLFGENESESTDSNLDFSDEEDVNDNVAADRDLQMRNNLLFKADAFWDENASSSEFSAKMKPDKHHHTVN
jgi:hypothetical protein